MLVIHIYLIFNNKRYYIYKETVYSDTSFCCTIFLVCPSQELNNLNTFAISYPDNERCRCQGHHLAAAHVPTARIIRADTHPPMVVDSVSGWRMGYNENRNLYIYTNMSNPNLRYWQCPTRRLAYVWEIHEFRARERLYFDPTEDENNEENNERKQRD